MKKAALYILFLLTVSLAVTAAGCGVVTGQWPPPPALPAFSALPRHPYQVVVDSLRALQPGDVPDAVLSYTGNYSRSNLAFDVNDYLAMLPHVTVWPGYALDYIYYHSGTGGHPLMYVRDVDMPRYETFFDLASNQADSGLESGFVVDGTKEGYFQMFLLDVLGPQFYLSGDDRYDDYKIICGAAGLDQVANDPWIHDILEPGPRLADLSRLQRLDPTRERQQQIDDLIYKQQKMVRLLTQASHLDLEPRVDLTDDTATVSVVVFTKWGGFSRQTVVFNRDYPHLVLNSKNQPLLAYRAELSY